MVLFGLLNGLELSFQRVNGVRVASKNLQKTLHVDNDTVVQDVLLKSITCAFHFSCCLVLKLMLDHLLNLSVLSVLLSSVLLDDGLDGFLDAWLLALFADLHDLSDHNVLETVLE